ncbi:hypothetical protein Gotur_007769 [Gossypium turneri]
MRRRVVTLIHKKLSKLLK